MSFIDNLFAQNLLGIDMGNSSIKAVELSLRGKKTTLKNYGFLELGYLSSYLKAGTSEFDADFVSKLLVKVLKQAKITTKKATFSIPATYTSCTYLTIPEASDRKNLAKSIELSASQRLAIPIEQVTLDWHIISDQSIVGPYEIFLTAIPNLLIENYRKVAKQAGLEIYAMETQAMTLARALGKNQPKAIYLLEISSKNAVIGIVRKNLVTESQNIKFDGQKLSQVYFLSNELSPMLDPILDQISKIYAESGQENIGEIYLSGEFANLPGLKEYLAAKLKKEVFIINCFVNFSYPPLLNPILKEMSPRFAGSVGAALTSIK